MPSSSDQTPVYDAQRIVCLTTLYDGDAPFHFPFENRVLAVCCPLYFAAFEADL